jgi:hydroxymethylpyrimidine/phosphomethylpyrimidine kinase
VTVPRVLVIAGSDSGGGAGIQADIRAITAFGGHAMTAITAVTAQNTLGVSEVLVLEPALVVAQIDAVLSDIGADAIKIGMIGSPAIAEAVADRLARQDVRMPLVFDPVMVATSGATLADAATIAAFERLMALATLVTPNLPELAVLSPEGPEALARRTGAAVLAKGGHGEGDRLIDRLVRPDGSTETWIDDRLDSRHTHGTGCTLASAITAGLAARVRLDTAVTAARSYVRAAILAAPELGQGDGPLGSPKR